MSPSKAELRAKLHEKMKMKRMGRAAGSRPQMNQILKNQSMGPINADFMQDIQEEFKGMKNKKKAKKCARKLNSSLGEEERALVKQMAPAGLPLDSILSQKSEQKKQAEKVQAEKKQIQKGQQLLQKQAATRTVKRPTLLKPLRRKRAVFQPPSITIPKLTELQHQKARPVSPTPAIKVNSSSSSSTPLSTPPPSVQAIANIFEPKLSYTPARRRAQLLTQFQGPVWTQNYQGYLLEYGHTTKLVRIQKVTRLPVPAVIQQGSLTFKIPKGFFQPYRKVSKWIKGLVNKRIPLYYLLEQWATLGVVKNQETDQSLTLFLQGPETKTQNKIQVPQIPYFHLSFSC